MPWKGVTETEHRQSFLEDYRLDYYSITELAERFSTLRKTAHPGLTTRAGKWIDRFKQYGQSGFHEQSRRPQSCPRDRTVAGQRIGSRPTAVPHRGQRSGPTPSASERMTDF